MINKLLPHRSGGTARELGPGVKKDAINWPLICVFHYHLLPLSNRGEGGGRYREKEVDGSRAIAHLITKKLLFVVCNFDSVDPSMIR